MCCQENPSNTTAQPDGSLQKRRLSMQKHAPGTQQRALLRSIDCNKIEGARKLASRASTLLLQTRLDAISRAENLQGTYADIAGLFFK